MSSTAATHVAADRILLSVTSIRTNHDDYAPMLASTCVRTHTHMHVGAGLSSSDGQQPTANRQQPVAHQLCTVMYTYPAGPSHFRFALQPQSMHCCHQHIFHILVHVVFAALWLTQANFNVALIWNGNSMKLLRCHIAGGQGPVAAGKHAE